MKFPALFLPLLCTVAFAQEGDPPQKIRTSQIRIDLHDVYGQKVANATFTETSKGVLVTIVGAVPVGPHAIHIHETGKCDPPGFESAGGHFNPARSEHGYLSATGPHLGDLPNVHAPGGQFSAEMFLPGVRLISGSFALMDTDGSAIVIHAGPDDYKTQPAGDSGNRIACGIL